MLFPNQKPIFASKYKPYPMLSIRNLHISFHSQSEKVLAVEGLNLELAAGKTLGIVGESGSGKSVTSLAIMRLLGKNAEISADSLRFEDKNLLELSPEKMRALRGKEIAMIFQEPMTSLNPVFTCGYQVAEALALHTTLTKKEIKEEVIRLFQKVELPRPEKIYEAYPHEISGGQKQRVMIAMAIACRPKLLIADEPTTALDVTVQKEVLQLLKQLQAEYQMAMIFISHDLGVIAEIADDVLVMYRGKCVEYDKVKNIFANPQHAYTQGLIACRPRIDVRVKRLQTVSDFLEKTVIPFAENVISAETFAQKQAAFATQEDLLKIEGLKTYFPLRGSFFSTEKNYVKAVDEVSFSLKKGETLGLVGESGCGKTTLGRSILRLIEPTAGSIYYKGKNLATLSSQEMRHLRKEMQIIFQDPYSSLNPKMRIGDAILEPMKVHNLYENDKIRKEKVFYWLEKVGLTPEHYQRFPSEFSGGQRQRVCIARALACEPSFVICDESVSALDVSIQAQILNLLKSLQEEYNFTYIFISHDLSVVKHISDRVAVMQAGKIIELNDAEQLYYQPNMAYTKKLLAAIPKVSIA